MNRYLEAELSCVTVDMKILDLIAVVFTCNCPNECAVATETELETINVSHL